MWHVGENAVVNYDIQSGLIAADGSSSGDDEAETEADEDGDVRASQIDLGVALSANTVDVLFGERSDGDVSMAADAATMMSPIRQRTLFGSDSEDDRDELLSPLTERLR